jgi:hypothetical protein
LPNPIAYWAAHLSNATLDAAAAITLGIELICPFFLFAPRRWRFSAVVPIAALQIVIALTGNYAFFNLLTLALCVWGLSDEWLLRWRRWLWPIARSVQNRVLVGVASAVLIVLMFVGLQQLIAMVDEHVNARTPSIIARAEIVNTYGLFAVMTTKRPELVIEGSDDNLTWKAYTFRYKPGPPNRSLPVVAPYQPRLDWQMWFAALGGYEENRWVGGLLYRLLTGDQRVLALFEEVPFKTPKAVRVLVYDYRFTSAQERAKTGAIWDRQLLGTWYGPATLRPR